MGLNDSNAENKQSVNDCGELTDILTRPSQEKNVEHVCVPPDGGIAHSRKRPLTVIKY